jgi:lipopolysaccharide transport system ATP-binding protein
MSSEVIISLNCISKKYEIYAKPHHRLLQLINGYNRTYYQEFWALKGISVELKRGESLAILGRNGAGKSTLLQIIAGVLSPTFGEMNVSGRVTALLELGSGFNPDFSGRENAYMAGMVLGLTQEEMDDAMPAIEQFASIGSFFDQPVKLYSTGMMVRVAFAVQVQLKPDILIVDEALAVGDVIFQKRCYQRILELTECGTSLLFVTHDTEAVRKFTKKALLLSQGKVLQYGQTPDVLATYNQLCLAEEKGIIRDSMRKQMSCSGFVGSEGDMLRLKSDFVAFNELQGLKERPLISKDRSFGDREAEITRIILLDKDGNEENVFSSGEPFSINIFFRTKQDMDSLYIGVRIRNKENVKIYSWGTFNQDLCKRRNYNDFQFLNYLFKSNVEYEVKLECPFCNLGQNFYEVEAYVVQQTALNFASQVVLHWKNEAAFFYVQTRSDEVSFGGVCDMQMKASLVNNFSKA